MTTDHLAGPITAPVPLSLQALADRVAALEATVASHAAMLGSAPLAPEVAPVEDCLRTVWDQAPIESRLEFVRAVLPADHPRQTVINETVSLLELAANPAELTAWIAGYPAPFADASAKLVTLQAPQPDAPADTLAWEVLGAARELAVAALAAAGISWIAPSPGEAIGGECEVLGDAPTGSMPIGRVHTLKRPGFRRNGRVELRAQVLRAAAGAGAAPVERAAPAPTAIVSAGPSSGGQMPDWLAELQRRASGAGAAATSLMQGLGGLPAAPIANREQAVRLVLEPLLPLLAGGWSSALADVSPDWLEELVRQRPRLEGWLRTELGVEVIAPREGEAFDSETMELTAERRTAHAHERGTVAKVHRAGLRSGRGVLVRAQVSRYSQGGAA